MIFLSGDYERPHISCGRGLDVGTAVCQMKSDGQVSMIHKKNIRSLEVTDLSYIQMKEDRVFLIIKHR